MIIDHESHCEANKVTHPDAMNAAMKVLITPENGWSGHVMRVIEIEEGGWTPKHGHPWPHINYILEGIGTLYLNGQETLVQPGSYAYVPDNEEHQFKNTGSGKMRFICIVPEHGHF